MGPLSLSVEGDPVIREDRMPKKVMRKVEAEKRLLNFLHLVQLTVQCHVTTIIMTRAFEEQLFNLHKREFKEILTFFCVPLTPPSSRPLLFSGGPTKGTVMQLTGHLVRIGHWVHSY